MPSRKNATKATVEETKGGTAKAKPATGAHAPTTPAASSKKSLGPKEPPPFVWKLVGRSGHHILTLFKAAEREDADAQLARLTREGYYKDLEILDINAAIKQPRPPKATAERKKPKRSVAHKTPPAAKRIVRQPVVAMPKARKAKVVVDKKKTAKASGHKKARARKASRATSPVRKKPARKAIKKKK